MKLELEIRDEDAEWIALALAACQESGCNSHGPLDIHRLARLLLEDVALAMRRPGSWEGANMRQLLRAHGYKV